MRTMTNLMLLAGLLTLVLACGTQAAEGTAPVGEKVTAAAVEGEAAATATVVAAATAGASECAGNCGADCPHAKAKAAGTECAGNCGADCPHAKAKAAGTECAGNCGADCDKAKAAGTECAGNCGADCDKAKAAAAAGGAADCPFNDAAGNVKAPEAATTAAAVEPAAAAEPVNKAGCAGLGAPQVTAEGPEGKHFGGAFALTEAKPLGTILAGATAEAPVEAIQASGTIEQVCQKKGCWFVLADGDKTARITMKGYGFTVPLDSKGKPAVVEGTLKVRTFTEAQVKHLEADRGGDPAKVSGTRTEYVLTASGVRIRG